MVIPNAFMKTERKTIEDFTKTAIGKAYWRLITILMDGYSTQLPTNVENHMV
jgi:hypothetical protein